MNYFLPFWSSPDYRQTTDYRQQTESGAYEPTVQDAQAGSKIDLAKKIVNPVGMACRVEKSQLLQHCHDDRESTMVTLLTGEISFLILHSRKIIMAVSIFYIHIMCQSLKSSRGASHVSKR